MTSWTGGLPPAAAERIARQRQSGVSGSLLSAPAAASIRAAGLAAVGEVFGCLVMNLGWTQNFCGLYGQTGVMGGGLMGGSGGLVLAGGGTWGPGNQWSNGPTGAWGYSTPVTTSGEDGGRNGFGPYVRSFEHAWNGALDRMLAEAAALGADGVVGVVVDRSRLENRAWEFTAMGTAVRVVDPAVAGPSTAGRPWAAGLSAEDCASAMLSGFVPRGLVLGLSVSTKHEDWQLKQQRSSWSNTEVTGMTQLIQAARADSRERLDAHARRLSGQQGELVITGMRLGEFETPCGEEQDLHAESEVVGTVLGLESGAARRRRAAGRSGALTIIPLTDATQRDSARRL